MSDTDFSSLQDRRILLVEDEEFVREATERFLISYDMVVVAVGEAKSALSFLGNSKFDVVVLDLNIPGGGGLAVYKKIREKQFNLPVIICSGDDVNFDPTEFRGDSYFKFLKKPYEPEDFLQSISALIS